MDLEGHIVELTQLRYFQTAAYYQHISRAAEELNISQPAPKLPGDAAHHALRRLSGPPL